MNFKLNLIILIACVSNIDLKAQADSSRPVKGWVKYSDSDYVISFPRGIRIEFNGAPGTRLMLITELENPNDSFRENIGLMSELNTNPNARLDHYVTASQIKLDELINNFMLIESTRTSINGFEAHKLIYSGKQGVYAIKWAQYLFLINGKAYILTYTSELNSFEKYLDTFEKIASSISFK